MFYYRFIQRISVSFICYNDRYGYLGLTCVEKIKFVQPLYCEDLEDNDCDLSDDATPAIKNFNNIATVFENTFLPSTTFVYQTRK